MPQTRSSSRRSNILSPVNVLAPSSSSLLSSSSNLKESKIVHKEEEEKQTQLTIYNSPSSTTNTVENQIETVENEENDENLNPNQNEMEGGQGDKVKRKKKKRTVSERSPALNKSRKKSTVLAVNKVDNDSSDSSKDVLSTPTKGIVDGSDDKETELLTPSVTPYWKVAEERGTYSPRETRSAKKSNRPCNIPRLSDVSSSPAPAMKKESHSTKKTNDAEHSGSNSSSCCSDSLEAGNVVSLQQDQCEYTQNDEDKNSKSSAISVASNSKSRRASESFRSSFCLDFSPPPTNLHMTQSRNKQLKEEIFSLKKHIKALKLNLDSSQKKNMDLEKEIMNLQARFEYQRDVKNLDMRLTKLSNALNNQNAQHELIEIINGLREEKKQLQLKLEEAERDQKKIINDYEIRQKDSDDRNHVEQEVVDSLRAEIEEQKQQREVVESNYQKVMNEFQTFHKEAGDLKSLVSQLREENSELKGNLEKEEELNERRKLEHEEAMNSLKASFIESQSIDSSALNAAHAEKMKVISQLEKIESELEMKNSTIYNMSDKEADLAKMNEELLKRCEESEKEIEDLSSEVNKLRESLIMKSSTLEELQQKLEDSEVVYDEAERMRDKLKEIQVEILEESKTNNQLREQSVLLQQTLNETCQKLDQTEESLSIESKIRGKLEEKIEAAQKDNQEKQEVLKTVEKKLIDQMKINEDLNSGVNKISGELKATVEKHSDEKKELLERITALEQKLIEAEAKQEDEKKNFYANLDSINCDLKEEKKMNEQLNEQLFQTMEQHDVDKKEFKKQLAENKHVIDELQRRCKKMMKQMSTFNNRESALCEKILMQEEVRRSLHNKVMQLCGNIRVFVRVRPMISGEVSNSASPYTYPTIYDKNKSSSDTSVSANDDLTKRFIVATEPEKDRGGLSQRRKKLKFGFDNVFDPTHGQDALWQATEPLIQSAIDGYNVCVFAYGQTGSGKTYTMLGTETNPGLITNAIKKLFGSKRTIEETSKGAATVKISVELLEIYNEQVRDLLDEKKGMAGYENVSISLNSNEAVGNIVYEAIHEDHVMTVLKKAQKRRCVKATKSNAESSRSHMIFTLNFNLMNASGVERKSRLSICDLAGSERLGKSESVGVARKEAQHINKSLSSLSNVIEKLQQKSSHIPYRESKLTYLLQNSLGGDSKTLAIVCCNPILDHFQETTCSLRFAQKLNKVELKALANVSC